MWKGLHGWGAGGKAAEMTGCDPYAADGLLERLRNVRESDLHGSGQFDGRLVPELADRAVLVDCVLLVADGRGERGAGQRQCKHDDAGAPAGFTSYETLVRRTLGHPLSTLAENRPWRQERSAYESPGAHGVRPDGSASSTPYRPRTDPLDSGALLLLNRWMVSLKRLAATGAALLTVLALASGGVALHEHDTDARSAGHADCDACHFRHLSGIAPDGTPAPSAPDLVAHAVVSAHPDGERAAALGILPTRGPPA